MGLFQSLKNRKPISLAERNILISKFDSFIKKCRVSCSEYKDYTSRITEVRRLIEKKKINKEQYSSLIEAVNEIDTLDTISEPILRITLERMEKVMWFKKKEKKSNIQTAIEQNEQTIEKLTIEAERLRKDLERYQKDEQAALDRKDRAAWSIAKSHQKAIGRELEVNTKALDSFINATSNLKASNLAKVAANYNRTLMAQAGLVDPSEIQKEMYELEEAGNSINETTSEIDSVFNQPTETDDDWQRALEANARQKGKEAKEFEEKAAEIRRKGGKDNA